MVSQTSCAVSPCVRAIMKKEEIEFRKKRLNFACLIVPFFYEFVFEVKNDGFFTGAATFLSLIALCFLLLTPRVK